MRRVLLWSLTGAIVLGVAIGAGIWVGLQLPREAPPAPSPDELTRDSPPGPSPADTPASQPPRVDAPPIEPAPGTARSDEDPPHRTQATPASVPEPVEAPRTGTTAEPVQAAAGPPGPAPEPASSDDPPGGDASKRAQVEDMLRRLEAMLASRPAGASPYPEFNAALERVGLGRTKALEAHGDGDIDSALRLLAEAEREAQELIRNEEARFRLSLQAAGEAYAAGNAETARMHVEQALAQRPGDPQAKLWESRTVRLPELLAERRKAQDARTARKLREERAALRRIVELDPDDTGAAQRVRAIDRQLREQAYARSIAQGRQAVEDRTLEPAKQALVEAQRRQPQHADTRALEVQVAALKRALLRDGHLAAAEQAAVRDDWEAALRAFEEARAVEPTHDEAVSGSTLAARLVKAQRTVDGFLSLPERLGTVAVADAARGALREAQALTALSARLAGSAQGLEHAIEVARTPVPVRILSDERTEIGIRGVGKVGQVRERTIELVPGAYVFEGKRKGYRSKLIEVLVEANPDAPVEVRVVCDERS